MRIHRYGLGARCYDVLSGERPVYRAGRLAGVEALRLHPGDRVLDVGCGTGLNLALIVAAVSPGGAVVGVDASPAMLGRARARVNRHGWENVTLHQVDAAQLAESIRGPFDAVVFTYSLSIIGGWGRAWAQALDLTRPGGRLAVVDLAMPRGRGLLWWPLARLACLTGGVNLQRRVWEIVAADCVEVSHATRRAGHIHVAAGTRPGDDDQAEKSAQTAQR